MLKVPRVSRIPNFLGESGGRFDNISSAVILLCLNKCRCCCNGTSPINFVLDRVRFFGIALLSATLILPNSEKRIIFLLSGILLVTSR